MKPHSAIAQPGRSPAVRLAWLASLAATLLLVALLGFARTAAAASPPPLLQLPSSAAPLPEFEALSEEEAEEAEAEEEELEIEIEECVEAEEGNEEECEEMLEEDEVPEECMLEEADAIVTALPAHNKVRLDVRYTTSSPASVALDYHLRGSKGRLDVGSDTKHFGHEGVLHHFDTLSDREMAKVLAAHEFTIELHAVNSPHYCRPLFERHLTVRHQASGGMVWLDPESDFRPSRRHR